MHNRDFIWITKGGEGVKIRDLSSAHLENVIFLIKKTTPESKLLKNFNQELRYRKLNNIEYGPDYDELF